MDPAKVNFPCKNFSSFLFSFIFIIMIENHSEMIYWTEWKVENKLIFFLLMKATNHREKKQKKNINADVHFVSFLPKPFFFVTLQFISSLNSIPCCIYKRKIEEIAFYVRIGYDSTYTSGKEKKISLRFGELAFYWVLVLVFVSVALWMKVKEKKRNPWLHHSQSRWKASTMKFCCLWHLRWRSFFDVW